MASSRTDTTSNVIASIGRSTASEVLVLSRLPMMIPGMEPASSDQHEREIDRSISQWPMPAISVSGTACAMSLPAIRATGSLG